MPGPLNHQIGPSQICCRFRAKKVSIAQDFHWCRDNGESSDEYGPSDLQTIPNFVAQNIKAGTVWMEHDKALDTVASTSNRATETPSIELTAAVSSI